MDIEIPLIDDKTKKEITDNIIKAFKLKAEKKTFNKKSEGIN